MNEEQKKKQKNEKMMKKINKKKICIVLLCIVIAIYAPMLLKNTLSKYQSQATTDGNVDVAFWIVSDTFQEANVAIEGVTPGTTQECVFTVSNNNGTIRTNAAIEYKIIVKTTTNLPLTYQLFKKTDTTEEECVLDSNELYEEDGTYYRELTATGFELGCNEDETTQFLLKATFPLAHNGSELADLIECVNLKIEAQQKISD